MKLIFSTLFLFLTFKVLANDGVYLSRGGQIFPIQESKISIEREELSFTVQNKICQVRVLFEFNNPEQVERKLLVGFQAPTAVGDVSDKASNTSQISNFSVMAHGQILPFQLKAAGCVTCELKDPKEFKFSQGEQGVFVYLFELTFKPGLNQIQHSYSFPASSNVAYSQLYNYILTTGSKWAGGTIRKLAVDFDLGSNSYFFVNDVFGKPANWMVIGSGKLTEKRVNNEDESARMVRLLSGSLRIEVSNFKPVKNIEFGIVCEHSFITAATDAERLKAGTVYSICGLELDKERAYSKEVLKLLRNTIYAQYGYVFTNLEMQNYFSQFEWYMPDPNLKLDELELSKQEMRFVEEISKREKE